MALGSAFQKVNFLRDLKNDFEQLERSYFPGVDLRQLDDASKQKWSDDAPRVPVKEKKPKAKVVKEAKPAAKAKEASPRKVFGASIPFATAPSIPAVPPRKPSARKPAARKPSAKPAARKPSARKPAAKPAARKPSVRKSRK